MVSKRVAITFDFLTTGETRIKKAVEGATSSMRNLRTISGTLADVSTKTNIPLTQLTKSLSKSGVTVDNYRRFVDMTSGEVLGLTTVTNRLNKAQDTFNMNYLGIMFAGMAVQKAFDGMQASAMKAAGVTEDWNYVLSDLFTPNASRASKAVGWLEERVENMHPVTRELINVFATVGSVLGRVTFGLGQFMLGFHAMRQELPTIIAWLKKKRLVSIAYATDLRKKVTPAVRQNNIAMKKASITMGSLAKGAVLATGAMLLLSMASNSEFITALTDGITDFLDTVWDMYQKFTKWIADMILKGKEEWILFFGTTVPFWIDKAKTKISETFKSIRDKISEKISNIKERFDNLKDTITTIFNTIKIKIINIFNTIKNSITDKITKVKEQFTTIKEKVTETFDTIKTTISEKIDTIKDKIETIKTKLKDTFDTIKDNISWDKLVEIGGTIMSKIADGMAAAKDVVRDAIYALPVIGPVVESIVKSGIFGIPALGDGGIVTSPTLAVIGERGPEAVVPLNGNAGIGGNITYNPTININANISNDVDIDYLTRRINENLYNETRRQGIR